MSFRGTLLVVFLFLLGVTFSGFASYSSTVINPKEPVQIDGKKLAAQNCASCHGKDLTGAVGPNLHEKGAKLSAETIAQVIRDGVGTKMPSGLLKNDKEIDAVAKYITTLGDEKTN